VYKKGVTLTSAVSSTQSSNSVYRSKCKRRSAVCACHTAVQIYRAHGWPADDHTMCDNYCSLFRFLVQFRGQRKKPIILFTIKSGRDIRDIVYTVYTHSHTHAHIHTITNTRARTRVRGPPPQNENMTAAAPGGLPGRR